MEINQELIACYIDGTATEEERNLVRKYMCEHPSCYEEILSLIERSKDVVEKKDFKCDEIKLEHFESHKAISSTTPDNKSFLKSVKSYVKGCCANNSSSEISLSMQVKRKPNNDLNKEINNMLDELNDIF